MQQPMNNSSFIYNNFDLIRLFAAMQVAVVHSFGYLSNTELSAWMVKNFGILSGVPIFFFISGFLISRAFEKNPDHYEYFRNRALRIFPALFCCVLVNLLLVWMTGYFSAQNVGFLEVAGLFLAKSTIVQFYNPEFMRNFGDGVLNGSLWTICVELQFYVIIPLLYAALKWVPQKFQGVFLVVSIILFLGVNRLWAAYQPVSDLMIVLRKLVGVSALPWLYMFLTGVLSQRYFHYISSIFTFRNTWLVILLYIPAAIFLRESGFSFGNSPSPVVFFAVAVLVLSVAYGLPPVSDKILHRNDFSYGVYIYHMVVVNQFLYLDYFGDGIVLAVLLLTFIAAAFSWSLVEKPFLSKKRLSLHKVGLV